MKVDQLVSGVVLSLHKFGVIVDLGGTTGSSVTGRLRFKDIYCTLSSENAAMQHCPRVSLGSVLGIRGKFEDVRIFNIGDIVQVGGHYSWI